MLTKREIMLFYQNVCDASHVNTQRCLTKIVVYLNFSMESIFYLMS